MANKKKRVSAVKVEEAVTPQAAKKNKEDAPKEESTTTPKASTAAGKRRNRGKINAGLKQEAGATKTAAPKKKNKYKFGNKEVVEKEKFEPSAGANNHIALYLHSWKHDRPNWKFQKKVQHLLLRSTLDVEKLPDESFNIAMEYFEEGRGNLFNVLEDATTKAAKELKKANNLQPDQSDRLKRILKVCKEKQTKRAEHKKKSLEKKEKNKNKKKAKLGKLAKPEEDEEVEEGSDKDMEGSDEEVEGSDKEVEGSGDE